MIVSGKTGSRRIGLISSVPHLSNWIGNHPGENDPNAPLWVNIGKSKIKENVERVLKEFERIVVCSDKR